MEKTASADPFLAQLSASTIVSPKSRALIAVSGGRDSVALLHALHKLGCKKLTVVHLDHQLRGAASRADAKFVQRLAQKLNLHCIVGHADVNSYARDRGISIEHAARELRHVFFANIARTQRCKTVLLAHHADDQIETCLFNFLRGSGAAGLAGMRAKSEHAVERTRLIFLRPMLPTRRAEIDAYIARHKIKYREDATNNALAATRNKLRHRVLPAIRETIGDSCAEAILRAATIFAAEEEWMQTQVGADLPAELSVSDLAAQPLALRRRTVHQWLKRSGLAETGLAEVERVLTLLELADGPAKVNLPNGRHARRRQGRLFLE